MADHALMARNITTELAPSSILSAFAAFLRLNVAQGDASNDLVWQQQ